MVPGGPIKNIIEKMFRAPDALEQEIRELHEMVGSLAEGDVDRHSGDSRRKADRQAVGAADQSPDPSWGYTSRSAAS